MHIDLAIVSPKFIHPNGDFSFILSRNKTAYEFISDKESVISDWLFSMKKICVHYMFHEEYKAIKMIGKGSFARVTDYKYD